MIATNAGSPEVAIIVVSWNTRSLLDECLRSVAADLAISGGVLATVYVVDNASQDGSVEMIQDCYPWVRLLVNATNVGFARANNQALSLEPAAYYLLLNSDARLVPGTILRLLAEMKESERVAVVGPALVNEDYTFQASYGRYPTVLSLVVRLLGLAPLLYGPFYPSASPSDSLIAQDVDWVGGACMMVRREAIEDVGLLDEGYFMYAEEMDWCWRMRRAGWRVRYTPLAVAKHLGGASTSTVTPWIMARQWRALLRFLGKVRGPQVASTVRCAVGVLAVLRACFYVARALPQAGQRPRLLATATANLNLALLRTRASV